MHGMPNMGLQGYGMMPGMTGYGIPAGGLNFGVPPGPPPVMLILEGLGADAGYVAKEFWTAQCVFDQPGSWSCGTTDHAGKSTQNSICDISA
jgi:hypothetical protein